MTQPAWYVARTEPRAEIFAVQALKERGIEAWVPVERYYAYHARRKSTKERPVIAGYVFFTLTPEQSFYAVQGVRQVKSFLGANQPRPVPFEAFAEIWESERAGFFDYTRPNDAPSFKKNDPVRIIGGPFAGRLAVIMAAKPGEARAKVFIEALGRFFGPGPANVPTELLEHREKAA